jgi:hypothetical protein
MKRVARTTAWPERYFIPRGELPDQYLSTRHPRLRKVLPTLQWINLNANLHATMMHRRTSRLPLLSVFKQSCALDIGMQTVQRHFFYPIGTSLIDDNVSKWCLKGCVVGLGSCLEIDWCIAGLYRLSSVYEQQSSARLRNSIV